MTCQRLLLLAVLSLGLFAEDIRFPEDPGVYDVTKAPFNADPSGKTDATEALRAAIAAGLGRSCFIYIPNGTYTVSGPLWWRGSKGWKGNELGWWARLTIRGQSRDKTIIRLIDKAPLYADPAKPEAIIVTASESPHGNGGNNQGFNNSIRNLTVDTGSGNPGAIGIDYVVSNQGAIQDVTIRSGDGGGSCGLRMEREYPGPGLIKNVEIRGFDYGIRWFHTDYSMTIENLTLKGQKKAGMHCTWTHAFIHNLISENSVPVIVNDKGGMLNLIGAKLSGGGKDVTAITGPCTRLLRDVTVSGYGKVSDEIPASGATTTVDEHLNQPAKCLFDAPLRTLRLKEEPTPEPTWTDPKGWAKVADFGAVGSEEKGANNPDATEAIQKALDSGKDTIWLSGRSTYNISKTLVVPPGVKLITGPHPRFRPIGAFFKDPAKPQSLFKITGNGKVPVIFDHVDAGLFHAAGSIGFDHAGTRPLVLMHGAGAGGAFGMPAYINSVTGGSLFIEDMMISCIRISGPHRLFARQFNSEYGSLPMLDISGKGASAWIMGWKTENSPEQIILKASDGAQVEAFGPYAHMNNSSGSTPCFLIDNATYSLSFRQGGQNGYVVAIKETRDGQTKELKEAWRDQLLHVGGPDTKAATKP